MAISMSSLVSSFSSLSFSSQVSEKPNTLSFPQLKPFSTSKLNKYSQLVFVSSSTAVASPGVPETENLEKYVKSRLPGGFAAQTIFGTGRRKSAIARVVLQEGTGKVIINYRDAKVRSDSLFFTC